MIFFAVSLTLTRFAFVARMNETEQQVNSLYPPEFFDIPAEAAAGLPSEAALQAMIVAMQNQASARIAPTLQANMTEVGEGLFDDASTDDTSPNKASLKVNGADAERMPTVDSFERNGQRKMQTMGGAKFIKIAPKE